MASSGGKPESFDSDQQYLGTVYAKALLGAVVKAENTEAVLSELDSLIGDVLSKLPKLERTLSSPRVPEDHKVRILDKVFGGKMTRELLNFLKVVVRHGRFDCLPAMSRAARRLDNETRGRVEVEVRTADTVGADLLDTISMSLQAALGCEVDIKTSIVPEVIGGMVVRVGDTVYDSSVANQLNRLRDTALEKTAQELRDSTGRFELVD